MLEQLSAQPPSAGALKVAIDLMKARASEEEGQFGTRWLCGALAMLAASSASAIAGVVTFSAVAVPILGSLIIVSVEIGLIIEYIKENA